VAGPSDHPIHRILLALEHGLNGAVWPIPYPTGDALLPGDAATRIPIEHALNHAVDDHPPAYHSRQVTGCINPADGAFSGLVTTRFGLVTTRLWAVAPGQASKSGLAAFTWSGHS
jgi:hypothetical protein